MVSLVTAYVIFGFQSHLAVEDSTSFALERLGGVPGRKGRKKKKEGGNFFARRRENSSESFFREKCALSRLTVAISMMLS